MTSNSSSTKRAAFEIFNLQENFEKKISTELEFQVQKLQGNLKETETELEIQKLRNDVNDWKEKYYDLLYKKAIIISNFGPPKLPNLTEFIVTPDLNR